MDFLKKRIFTQNCYLGVTVKDSFAAFLAKSLDLAMMSIDLGKAKIARTNSHLRSSFGVAKKYAVLPKRIGRKCNSISVLIGIKGSIAHNKLSTSLKLLCGLE